MLNGIHSVFQVVAKLFETVLFVCVLNGALDISNGAYVF